MKLCTAVQEGCGYKDTLRARRYFAPLAKYFAVCITYQPAYVFCDVVWGNRKLTPVQLTYAISRCCINCAIFQRSWRIKMNIRSKTIVKSSARVLPVCSLQYTVSNQGR